MALTQKQLAERVDAVCSSEAAAVLGVNPYTTAEDVLREKVYGIRKEVPAWVQEAGYWGDVMEPILRKEFAKRTGHQVKTVKRMYRHPVHTFVGAHIDGLILKPEAYGVLEIKTIRHAPKNWMEHYHWVQLQHGMLASGCLWGCLAVLAGGNDFQIHEFQRDEEFLESAVKTYAAFWDRVTDERKGFALSQAMEATA